MTVRTSAKLRVAVKGEDSLTGDVPVGGLNLALGPRSPSPTSALTPAVP